MTRYKIYTADSQILESGIFSGDEAKQKDFFESFFGKYANACYMVFFQEKEYKGNHFMF